VDSPVASAAGLSLSWGGSVFWPRGANRYARCMDRPAKFEHHRFVGDKRTLRVYDLDEATDEAVIDELMASGRYLCFGPDTLAEARNRGFKLRSI
jgi:hypothetical protein